MACVNSILFSCFGDMADSTSTVSDQSADSSLLEKEFCTPGVSGIEGCLQYLHQELQTIGLPSVLVGGSTQPDAVQLVNTVYRLLQLHRASTKSIEELKASLQRAKSDVLLHKESQDRLKEDLKAAERELTTQEGKERQLSEKFKSLSSKLRAEQEEVRRVKLSLQYKETQFSHESRKREKEYERLKQKLGQLVSDKSQDRRLGMSILNSLRRADGKRKTWDKPGSKDEEMYRVIVSNYEERQKELMVENASLRESLASVQKDLISLLNRRQARQQEESHTLDSLSVAATTGDDLLSSGHFQMPFDIVRDGIEQSFRDKCRLVKDHIEELWQRIEKLETNQLEGLQLQDCESEIQQLEHKLSDYRDIIGQQEEMLQKTAADTDEEEHQLSKLLNESRLWKGWEQLEAEKLLFKEQQQTFEGERQKYLDAARRLDRERQIFEDEKAAFLREQFLDASILNSTRDVDSFYMKLSSTPASKSNIPETPIEGRVKPEGSSTSKGPNIQPDLQVDLLHNLSLCSDDGLNVLNDRPDCEESDSL